MFEFGFEFEFEFELDFELKFELDFELDFELNFQLFVAIKGCFGDPLANIDEEVHKASKLKRF